MNNGFTKLFMFAAGASIGALVAWKVTEMNCIRIAKKEMGHLQEQIEECIRNEGRRKSE